VWSDPPAPVGVLQLTETWGDRLFGALSRAGGKAYSNMAVGFNNVDVEAANRHGIAVGNTPVGAPCTFIPPAPLPQSPAGQLAG